MTSRKLKRPPMPGAGRPRLGPERLQRVSVMLDAETVALARALGNGSLSAGLREAVRLRASSAGSTHQQHAEVTGERGTDQVDAAAADVQRGQDGAYECGDEQNQ